MRRLLVLGITLLIFCFAAPAAAYKPPPWSEDGPSRAEDLHVYLLTFGVGDDIASWFGHTALMVRDDRLREERVYNYGMFDFGPTMLLNFLSGRLEFWVGEASVTRTLELYESLRRDVQRSELNLPPKKRRALAAFLAWNVLPENRDYLYDHYSDNCATRIRDAIDMQVDGQLAEAAAVPSRTTLRGHTHIHTQRNAYIDLLLSIWMNDEIDGEITAWEDMFLPVELLRQVESLEYSSESGDKVKLVPQTEVLFQSTREKPPFMPATRWMWSGLFGIVFGLLGFIFARKWETTSATKWRRLLAGQHFMAGLLFGVPGLVSVLFHFTDHKITFWNENMLLWSPLTFMALILSFPIMRARPWALTTMKICWYVMAATSVLAVALKVLPMFDQANGLAIAMLLPFNLFMAAAMHRFGPTAARQDLTQVDDDIWAVSSKRRFLDLQLGSRMTIVRLSDGGLWVHSPIAIDQALREAVDALGEVRHLVGPNLFHHMHLKEWATAYPDAKVYGAPRLAQKRSDLKFDGELGDEAPDAWSGELEQHAFAGVAPLSEVMFYHPATKTLIATDLAVNFGSSDHLPTRIYLKLNAVENRYRLSPIVRVCFLDKAAAKVSVARVLEWDFERITMCHGNIVEQDAKSLFEKSFEFLG